MTAPQAEAVIDLDTYRRNLELLRAVAPTAQQLAVVKADAYGHGLAPVARAARDAGAEWLGVATLGEALALREAGDVGPVLCWLNAPGADYAAAHAAGIEVTASSAEQLAEVLAAAPGRVRVQLKVDTGLSRNGARGRQWDELVAAAAAAVAAGRLEVGGTWSHLACADDPDHPANAAQRAAYDAAIETVRAAGLEPGLRHLANSAATIVRPDVHLDLVRVGIASYGLSPGDGVRLPEGVRPVMTLRAQAAAVKRVPAGAGVSYGHTYVTDRETTLVDVPVGYADGILRTSSGRAEAAVGGRRVPVAGVVCMDQLVLDVGDLAAERGDVVHLFGPGDHGEPTADDWGRAAGTIGYEVVTRLGGRVVRSHRGGR
ncbi:MAG: alanine racemase [Aeromicrobium erythreum]